MKWWVAGFLLLILGACAGDRGEFRFPEQPAAPPSVELPAPLDVPVRTPSALVSSLDGAQFTTEGIAPRLVSADGDLGRFEPGWDLSAEPPLTALACALYVFELEGYIQGRYLCNEWSAAPANGELWLGLGDHQRNTWDWYSPVPDGEEEQRLLVPDVAPYLAEDDTLLAVAVVTASGEFALSRLWFEGQPPQLDAVIVNGLVPGGEAEFCVEVTGDEPLSYDWDFGEGAWPRTSADPVPLVTLGPPGVYTGSIRIENPLGSCQLDFQYKSGLPTVDWVEPQGGFAGTTVHFSASVGGIGPIDFAWDFGGGAEPDTSSEAGPSVTLGAAGEYDASLTVSDGYGEDLFEFTLMICDWPEQLWIFPDPDDPDWEGVQGSGVMDDEYILRSEIPPFNVDYQMYFSLAANSQQDGGGIDIDPALLSWDAWPPFAVEDPSWSEPGVFQANGDGFTGANSYIFAMHGPDESNYVYVTTVTEAP